MAVGSDESRGYRDWQRLVVFGTTRTVQFLTIGNKPQATNGLWLRVAKVKGKCYITVMQAGAVATISTNGQTANLVDEQGVLNTGSIPVGV